MNDEAPSLWHEYHEKLLKKWSEMSKTYSIMHTLCAHYYSKWDKRLGIPIVIIGGITASSIFSNTNPKDNADLWSYINGSLALIVTTLAGISNFLGMSQKTSKHQSSSFKYTKIAMDIDTVLSFHRNERKELPQDFIECKKNEILEIRENSEEILSWVIASFLHKFNKSLINTQTHVCNAKDNIELGVITNLTEETNIIFDNSKEREISTLTQKLQNFSKD